MASKGKAKVEKASRALEELKVEYVQADALRPNAYNPNRQSDHDFRLLCKSMKEDGFTQPIIVQRSSGEIVDGEHRWTAAIVLAYLKAKKLEPTDHNIQEARDNRLDGLAYVGATLTVPVVRVDMADAQMKISTLRHNRARGSEDVELGAAVLRDLQRLGALDWAVDSLELDQADVDILLKDIGAAEAGAGEEFNEGWAPSSEAAASSVGQRVDSEGIAVTQDATREAVEAMRVQERRLAAATTEQEKAAVRKDLDIFRVSLIFAGDDAVLVRKALGDNPAQAMLGFCRAATGAE